MPSPVSSLRRHTTALLRLCIAVVAMLLVAAPAIDAKKKRTSADVRRQRQRTEQELARTSHELSAAEQQLAARVDAMGMLQVKIDAATAGVRRLQQRIDSLNAATAAITDSIATGEQQLATLRGAYKQAVRAARRNRRQMEPMAFLFSADNFTQAHRRMRYVEQYSAWRGRKTDQIHQAVEALEAQRTRLRQMHSQVAAMKSGMEHQRRDLKAAHDSVAVIAGTLRGETRRLNALLKKQQSTLQSLDDEITRLIAQEEAERRRQEEERRRREAEEAAARAKAAKEAAARQGGSNQGAPPASPAKEELPAPAKPTAPIKSQPGGGFAAQKGRLPSPLSHTHVVARRFGVQKHPALPKVEINNPGVDLETAATATARAIYPGEVSAVFMQSGYDHVVLVRHGDYLTVYANIKTLSVKKGDKLKAGAVIGTVGPSGIHPSRGMLHFEIRREKTKYNPLEWLKN